MATYVVGDIHGCFETLQALLAEIAFAPEHDRLWLVGDLVNRGPASAEVLRWASRLPPGNVAVLGNHDANLLAIACGAAQPRPQDNSAAVLAVPDAEELLLWLGSRPLFHREGSLAVVHAGLLPAWNLDQAEKLARDAEAELGSPARLELLGQLKRGPWPSWNEELPWAEKVRLALGAFLHLRTLDRSNHPVPYAGPPDSAPDGCRPWFALPHRRSHDALVFFGHWAALGLYHSPGAIGLDSGCAWGGPLSALRLEDRRLFQARHRDGLNPR